MFITSASLAQTAAKLRDGTLDVRAYITQLCDRLDAIEPHIQAFLPEPQRRARLLREAAELSRRFPDPASRPPFFGVPVGVKDLFRANGFPTQAGSRLPAELFFGAEASCVTRLRDAGALIVGKTVTTEFAYFEPGPTHNPHHLQHTPGGSSSGSAAAVTCGMCLLALGTQTIGSIIRPAAFCGVIGFKPSFGRIPTDGVIPFAPSADHIGIFTQDVAGMALAAAQLCADWKTPGVTNRLPVLGVPEGRYLAQASSEGLAAFETQLDKLAQAGYGIKRVPALADIDAINQRHRRMIAAEFAHVHAAWRERYAEVYRPRTLQLIETGRAVTAAEVAEARTGRLLLRADLADLQASAQIDLWVTPAACGDAPEGLHATGDPIMNLPWTYAGLPAITLPVGTSARSLPLGLQCVAGFMRDEQLIAWAHGLAQVFAP